MITRFFAVIVTAAFLLVACQKKSEPSALATPSAQATVDLLTPGQATLAAASENITNAVTTFITVDWSVRPLFATNSTLSLSEAQFKQLSDAERQARFPDMNQQLQALKKVAAAVFETGRDAGAKGDIAMAQNCFMAVKQCGVALKAPQNLLLVQLVGTALIKKADEEVGKLHP